MHIQYLNPGFDHAIDSIMLFQTGAETPYWSDVLFYFYPQLDKEHFLSLPQENRAQYLTDTLRAHWQELQMEWEASLPLITPAGIPCARRSKQR